MIIIGDVHGCFKTFQALLKKIPDQQIILTGDLIDRGPRSKEVVQFMLDHKDILCVKGNHEEMLEGAVNETSLGFFNNGGYETLSSYNVKQANKIPEEHLFYLKNLPIFYEKNNLFVSHACVSPRISLDLLKKHLVEYQSDGLTWCREEPATIKGLYLVCGHTPIIEPLITKNYALIDTGCCFKSSKYKGYLTALKFPENIIYQQENID